MVRPPLWTAATNGPIVHPRVIYEYGDQWWNKWQGKIGENHVQVPLCPPEIPYGITRASDASDLTNVHYKPQTVSFQSVLKIHPLYQK
jgi:hypothetical protein